MNTLKIQSEILKALIKGTPVKCSFHHTDKVFITLDGKVDYIIPDHDLKLRLGEAEEIAPAIMDTALQTALEPWNLLEGTDTYRRAGTARKYLNADGKEVYVDQGQLKCFDRPKLYQEPDNALIVVTEDIYEAGAPIVVGVVCPINIEKEND